MPAFGGLLSPHWQPKARAVLVGMSAYSNRKHIVRAVLEASAYQTREILDAMIADSGVELTELKVDGGSPNHPDIHSYDNPDIHSYDNPDNVIFTLMR